MIKYRIFNSDGHYVCNKYDDGHKSHVSQAELNWIIYDFIKSGYKIIISGDVLVLKGKEAKFIIRDYEKAMQSDMLARLNADVKIVAASDGVCKTVSLADYNRAKKNKLIWSAARNGAAVCLVASIIANGSNILADFADYLQEVRNLYSTSEFESPSLEPTPIPEPTPTPEPTPDPKEVKRELYKEKICDFIIKENITVEQFDAYLTLLVDGNNPFGLGFKNEGAAFLNVCFRDELTVPEMFLMVMIREGLTYDQMDYMCAGCVGEAAHDGQSVVDACAVASTLVNRTHTYSYVNKYGTSLYDQFMAPGQYPIELSGNYKKFLGRIDLPGYKAVVKTFYTGESMHRWIEFRGSWVNVPYAHESFVEGGNQYLDRLTDKRYYEEPVEELDRDEVMKLVRVNDEFLED